MAKVLAPVVGCTEHSVKDSKEFCEYVKSLTMDPQDIMVSFDVVSLFTTIPVEMGVEVARKKLQDDDTFSERSKLSVQDTVNLLTFCLKSTEFVFNGRHLRQTFGCAMGSPVSALIANLVMEDVERRILKNKNFGVKHWKRFVDDTWVVLPRHQLEDFSRFINQVEPSIQFTSEIETGGRLAFLDVEVERRQDGRLARVVHRKATHTGKYLDFSSHHPPAHKTSVVRSLLDRVETHVSDELEAKAERRQVWKELKENGYPRIGAYRHQKIIEPTRGTVVLPYIKGTTDRVGRILRSFDLKVFFKPATKISAMLHPPKSRPPVDNTKGVVYKVECQDCQRCYIGQTGNALRTRIKQHEAAYRLMNVDKSVIAKHAHEEDHRVDWKGAQILAREPDYRKRKFLESWHIQKASQQCLNRTDPIPAVYTCLFT